MPGYRNRSLTIPVPTPTAPEQTSTAREKLLASMGRLPLHKLQDLDGTEDAQQVPGKSIEAAAAASRVRHQECVRGRGEGGPPTLEEDPHKVGQKCHLSTLGK